MPETQRGGVTLHYEVDAGPTDRPAVVLLQPAGAGRWSVRWQRECLRGRYRVIVPDTRGTGRSDPGLSPLVARLPNRLARPLLERQLGHTPGTLAADLEAVLADAGVPWAHLVGIGLGASVALAYAAEYDRARSLAVCFEWEGDLSRPFRVRNPHLADSVSVWRAEQDPKRSARAAQRRALGSRPDLERVRVPTLVLTPEEGGDRPERIAEDLPDARLERLGGDGLPTVEKADAVNDRLTSFLAEREAGRPAAV